MIVFFFNDTATTEIYTLSLHDALPILGAFMFSQACKKIELCNFGKRGGGSGRVTPLTCNTSAKPGRRADRKSTRLNSSHANISYAVFCLKKKKKTNPCTHYKV